ncbi:hypothetical protein SISNIDRAFT_177363 [Sistotremastrum niveocremeum HHB9708]|uniref:RRM Nup35-type domain-containing protein n=1 Tax=Sistotremastrum niveocremeum HHB9708 TaxID=1314777 RepID=A0A164RSB2_9AGAM|nr:hypothetical protein SISNIDRAFT_177363 [Sistotremastrum niveocremeum HHB9708]
MSRLSPSHSHSFGHASEFGSESLFQRSTRRPVMSDEDAPPTTSVVDIPNSLPSMNSSMFPSPFKQAATPPQPSNEASNTRIHYIIVFGFPSAAAYVHVSRLFAGLGETTSPEPAENSGNWFKIGFRKEWEARRAVRRNGELIHGDDGSLYMIGVKWADPTQDLASSSSDPFVSNSQVATTSRSLIPLSQAQSFSPSTPLAPASAAFRRPEPPRPASQIKLEPLATTGQKSWIGTVGDMILSW